MATVANQPRLQESGSVEIRHERWFRFVVYLVDDEGWERYFGYRWTFWGAQRLADRGRRQVEHELARERQERRQW